MINKVNIVTDRFFMRELTLDDATERYLKWFHNSDTKKFITASTSTKSLSDIKQFIIERIGREDILFLGIFKKNSELHIGNIKFEPVDSHLGYAIMGIMIGDLEFRGKGVGSEVLKASSQWLKLNRNINQIVLGVSKDNPGAIKSYEKVGFIVRDTPHIPKLTSNTLTMVLNL
jgi:ribosomal-protein-alanine N-acetyltransferase